MVLDIKRHRKQIEDTKPEFNLVPFIDILFTLLIFLVVTSSFSGAGPDSANERTTGKPDITDTSGTSEYYLIPVAGLEKITVNGQDMSSLIKDHSIAVHTKVIDEGEISIKPKYKTITITAPPGMDPKQSVRSP